MRRFLPAAVTQQRRTSRVPATPPSDPDTAIGAVDSAVDSAWKIHAAVADWTGRVDVKASFALAAESAATGIILRLREAPGPYYNLPHGPAELLYWTGIFSLGAAILCAMWVVRPRLRAKHLRAEAPDNYLYFGHLRHWEPDKLQQKLIDQDMLAPLCTNIINASKVAWVKHRCVQASLTLTAPAALSLIATAVIAG